MAGKHAPVEERFNRYFVKGSPDECWEWVGCKNNKGYGVIKVGSKVVLAHRLALEFHLGRPIIEGMFVLHSCDNPACVNPLHQREGTQQENVDDMILRLRGSRQKLTWDQIADIRSRVSQTQSSIAKEFGIGQTQISKIRNNKRWKVCEQGEG